MKGGSVAAQAFASQALANAAQFDMEEGQNAIARAGAIPTLLKLLEVGKAQMPAAGALANLARNNPRIQSEIASAGGIAPLLSLLNSRNTEAQVQAASALAELAWHNSDTQAAIAKAGGIGPLLALLTSRSTSAQSQGMSALGQLAHHNADNQDAIAKMGGLKPLVNLLSAGGNDMNVQANAASALMEITRSNRANQQSVVDNMGVSALALLMKNSPHAKVKAEAAGALWSLSEDSEIKISIAGASTVAPLVALLGSGGDHARDHAYYALASIGLDNIKNQTQITQLLIELLLTGTEMAQTRAVTALQTLVKQNPSSHYEIAKAGNPAALVDLLQHGIPDAKDYALWALSLSISKDSQQVVAESGGIQPLIKQLGDERIFIREQAAAALAKLAHDNDETRIGITTAGGVKPLIDLLSPSDDSSETLRQNSAAGLADLAVDPTARDEIVGTGGIRPLVLLLEDGGRNTKRFAAMALARLSKNHEATQVAIAEAGAIVPLVALLGGKEGPEAQEEAAGALFALSDHERNRMAITEADGIGWLVMLLGCDNPRAREHAEGALVRLSMDNANRVLIIKKLVDMLKDTGNSAQEQAAAALANLARESQDNRKSIVDANGVGPLLDLLESASAKAKENSVSAIMEICRNSRENQNMIAKANEGTGIARLVGVILGFSTLTMKDPAAAQLCTLAASAIREMAKHNKKNKDAIAAEGGIAPLVTMLASASSQMQANAAGALAHLARDHFANQAAIAKTGAVGPLCTLVREGAAETKDKSASAIWALSTDNAPNKDTIAKLGGIDPLVGLLVTGTSEKSQQCVAGALGALASKHLDNRLVIAKRLVGLLGSSAARAADRAVRVLRTLTSFTSESAANQVAIAKGGGIPPLITWLSGGNAATQAQAAHALVSLSIDNLTTQMLIAKSNAIPPLINLIKRASLAAQEMAARSIWHLASQAENQVLVVDAGGIKPFVGMLSADGKAAPELSSVIMVRLARTNPDVSFMIADKGGIIPLIKIISRSEEEVTPGAKQQAASALAELALVSSRNRDSIANSGGIEPLIRLIDSSTIGTPETAARALAHLSREDLNKKEEEAKWMSLDRRRREGDGDADALGSSKRRVMINQSGGIKKLIAMLDGSIMYEAIETKAADAEGASTAAPAAASSAPAAASSGKGTGISADGKKPKGQKKKPWEPPVSVVDGKVTMVSETNNKMGMQEQAAAALADVAFKNGDMQDAIIEAGGVPPLLSFMRAGSQAGQEHTARAIWHLAEQIDNQDHIVDCGTIPELVTLLKYGSSKAQELAAAGISDLAGGAIVEMERSGTSPKPLRSGPSPEPRKDEFAAAAADVASAATAEEAEQEGNRLTAIADAGGITPLVALLGSSNTQARENASAALWHLALDYSNQLAISKANGISPLVTVLDDGTVQAHEHAANALKRLAMSNADNRAQIAKHLVQLLGNPSSGAQQRSAHALRELAGSTGDSPVIIVNAGAISPLVALLSFGTAVVKEEAAGALSTLAMNSPSNQLAIATGLVALLGTGSAESQEHVTQLLVTLAHDPDNRVAISKAGAIQRLVVQLRGGGETSIRAQELSAAVLSHLSGDSEENVASIASSGGIRPLVALLTSVSAFAQAHSAAVLSDMARKSRRLRNTILSEGGITPLVSLLNKDNHPDAKAEAAGALISLSAGHPETQKTVADAGALKLLVALLSEDHDTARKKAAGAIAALSLDSAVNQDAVEKHQGIGKLVGLLESTISDKVRAEAAEALAVLARGFQGNPNKSIQDHVSTAGGISLLVALLHGDTAERAKESAAAALWSLATKHYNNQVAVADADGIAPLVAVVGICGDVAQEQAAGALAALALDNSKNEVSIAKLTVALLGSDDKQASAKAALAISRLARSHSSNQAAIANAGGVTLLVSLLDAKEGGVGLVQAEGEPPADIRAPAHVLESAKVQKEIASALWSMSLDNSENQIAAAKAGGIHPLIELLEGHPEVHRDAAGALWSLAANRENQMAISKSGGIAPLVSLVTSGSSGAKETAAGALHALAEASANRVSIAEAGGITPLVALFEEGSAPAKEQAAGALQALAVKNPPNQLAVAQSLVEMLSQGSTMAQEHVTQVIRNLAEEPENRGAIAKAGAVPQLVRQLESGSEKATVEAAAGLRLVALTSAKANSNVTQELVKLLASDEEAVRQRASETLRSIAAEDNTASNQKKKTVKTTGGGGPLVNLLKDGLKDDNTEAQEYALWSLSSITDAASREEIVQAGGIKPLITSLVGGKLSAVAQEHAAVVLSGLAPVEDNAKAIRDANGIDPLVLLLIVGNMEAKEHAASTLAQLALRADAALSIAKAGAISAFVTWLVDPSLGPPGVAASALSDIALDSSDTQSQIAEEGAISPLVAMVLASSSATVNASLLKLANKAAGAIATLAKDNIINQITVAEEGGIPPLVGLLKDSGSHENTTKALWQLAATEENQLEIARAGGIDPLVRLLTNSTASAMTQQYTAAALEALARDCTENQIALAQAGAIVPLVSLLGSDSIETQKHSVGALLFLAASDEVSRNAVVDRLVHVLDLRSAAAQMKSAEALAVLAARSAENRKAITDAGAIPPLVRLLGDGRRAREETPQERAAAVLADLARLGENKLKIVEAGGVKPLVAMLSSDACESAQTQSAASLWHLAGLSKNKEEIVSAGGIPQLVGLLATGSTDGQKFTAGTLWHLASSADNKVAMVNAGVILPLVQVLSSKSPEAREHAAAVASTLARTQGGNKRAIFDAGGIPPLIKLLSDASTMAQKHAASALWGLADGKDGVFDKQIVEAGAVQPLIALLLNNHHETRGFAAACLSCLCTNTNARQAILDAGGAEPLMALAHSPATWLKERATEMLRLLDIPIPDADAFTLPPSFKSSGGSGDPDSQALSASQKLRLPSPRDHHGSPRREPAHAKMKFHFFSFQINKVTGFQGFA